MVQWSRVLAIRDLATYAGVAEVLDLVIVGIGDIFSSLVTTRTAAAMGIARNGDLVDDLVLQTTTRSAVVLYLLSGWFVPVLLLCHIIPPLNGLKP